MFKDIICCCVIDEFTNLMLLMRCNRIRNIDNTGQIVLREVTMQYTPPSYILEHMKKHKEILGDNISTQHYDREMQLKGLDKTVTTKW